MPATFSCRVAGWDDLPAIVDLLNDDELGQHRNPRYDEAEQLFL